MINLKKFGIFLVFLAVVDGLLTTYGVSNHISEEGNPLYSFFINHIGIIPAMFVYIFIIGVFISLLVYISKKNELLNKLTFGIFIFRFLKSVFVIYNWVWVIIYLGG